MAGIEGLTPEQTKQLATGMHALLNSQDSDVRRGTQRLLKKVDPNLQFPEIEMESAIESAVKPLKDANEKLVNELKEKEFTAEVREQHKRVVNRGYKVEDVQRFMTEKGIVNFDTAMDVLDLQSSLATPTPDALTSGGVYEMPENSKEIFKNPSQWARRTAHTLIDQLKARKRA